MFGKGVYENSRSGGLPLLQVIDPEAGEAQLFVPLKRSELRGEVSGPLASLRLTHVYGYSREQCDRTLEAVYRFPLPGDAAVTAVSVRFGQVEIQTQLKEREQAEGEYEQAAQEGKQAALLTRESADVFTLRITGLQPDQEVQVETCYVQLARPQGETPTWSLRLPLTTAPRYVREDEIGSSHARGQPLALLRDPGHRFSLDLLFRDTGSISSPTHTLDVSEAQGGSGATASQRVCLAEGEVLPDRDLVLLWSPRQEADRPTLSAMTHRDADWLYFLALVAPPATHEPGTGVPREALLLVDHSGSMSGPKWEATDYAVNHFLLSLTDHDYLNLGLFHNTCKWYAPAPRLATEQEQQNAARFLIENRDSGGTNLGVALEQALRLPRPKGGRARHVLVLTDAQVSDAGRIFRLADGEARHPQRRRISVLCIDAAPNAFLAHELAERGGGLARFLTSSPDEGDITTALEDVLADWAEPVLAGLTLTIDRGGGQAAGREADASQPGATRIDLGDLPHGRALWVAGRVPAAPAQALAFELKSSQSHVGSTTVEPENEPGDLPALKALFGARRVLGLEYLMNAGLQGDELKHQLVRLGYSTADLETPGTSAVYAENVREETRNALKGLLVRESLPYGLVCAETAFVAVRAEAGEQVSGSVIVPSALPAGWSDQFLTRAAAPSAGMAMMLSAAPLASTAQPKGAGGGLLHRISAIGAGRRLRAAQGSDLAALPPTPDRPAVRPALVSFTGRPSFDRGQAVLIEETMAQATTLSRIAVELDVPAAQLDRGLELWIYVQDVAVPRARIRLADLMRLGGKRPLNLAVKTGEVVRIVLVDSKGVWAAGAPSITVRIAG